MAHRRPADPQPRAPLRPPQGHHPLLPRLDGNGNPTGEIIPGIDPVFTWNNISPRIGFAYALGDKRADRHPRLLRGLLRRQRRRQLERAAARSRRPSIAYWGESWDGPWDDEPCLGLVPRGDLNVDPDLKAPRTLQYSIGFEHAFADNYSFGVTGLYKDTKDLVGWQILDDGVYEELPWTDPFTGDQYTLLDPIVFPTLRKGNTPGFTVDPNSRQLLAGVLGGHPHLQPALRRLLEHEWRPTPTPSRPV